MARSHARILTSIWGDKDFKDLSRDAQLAYFMLLSQPDLGHSGLLSITVRRWAGLSADGTKESVWAAITELAGEDFLVVDEDTEEILIRSLVRNDGVWKQPKVLAVALVEAARISSPLLRARFAKEMGRIDTSSLPDKTKGDVEALLKALPDALTEAHLEVEEQRPHPPADPPPHPPADAPSNAPAEGDAEGDRGTRARAHRPQSPAPTPATTKNSSSPATPSMECEPGSDGAIPGLDDIPSSAKRPEPGSDDDPDWRKFWDLWPKKVGKPDARKAWAGAVKKVAPFVIIAGADRYRQLVAKERRDKRHIKDPSGWLNGERWSDEINLEPADGSGSDLPERDGYKIEDFL
jgi:hypothetical protein